MSYRVDIPTLSANEVYTLTFEYEGTETIQLIVGDLTLETTDRRVVFTTTSPVNYIESNVNLINLNMYEGYYESDDFGGEYTQESIIEGKSLINYKRRVDYGTLINNANIQETFTDDGYINYKQLGTGTTGRGFRGNGFAKNIDQSKNYTIILRVRKNTFPTDVFVPFTLSHKAEGVKFDEAVKGDYWGISYNISGGQTGVWKAVVKSLEYNVSLSGRYWGSIESFFVDENSEVTDLTQRTDIVGCEIEYAIEVLQGDYFDDELVDTYGHFEGIGCVKSPKIVSYPKYPNIAPNCKRNLSSVTPSVYRSDDNSYIKITDTGRWKGVGFGYYPQDFGYGMDDIFCLEFDVIDYKGTGTISDGTAIMVSIDWGAYLINSTGAFFINEIGHYKEYFRCSGNSDNGRVCTISVLLNTGTAGINTLIEIDNLKVYKIDNINDINEYEDCKISTPDDLELYCNHHYDRNTKTSNPCYQDTLDLTTGTVTRKNIKARLNDYIGIHGSVNGALVTVNGGDMVRVHYNHNNSSTFIFPVQIDGHVIGTSATGIVFNASQGGYDGRWYPTSDIEHAYADTNSVFMFLNPSRFDGIDYTNSTTIKNWLIEQDFTLIIKIHNTSVYTEQLPTSINPLKSYYNGSIQTSSQQLTPTLKTTLPVSNKFTTTNLTSGATYNVYFDGTATKLDAGGTVITNPVSPCEVECGGTTLTIEGTDIQNVRVIETTVKNEVGSVNGTTDVELSKVKTANSPSDSLISTKIEYWEQTTEYGNALRHVLPIQVKPNTKYILNTTNTQRLFAIWDANRNELVLQNIYVNSPYIWTTPADCPSEVYLYLVYQTDVNRAYLDELRMFEGEIDFGYQGQQEPLISQSISTLEQPIKLRSLGTTYDSYNPITGELIKRIGVSETDGSYSVLSSPIVMETRKTEVNGYTTDKNTICKEYSKGYEFNTNGQLVAIDIGHYTDYYIKIPKNTKTLSFKGMSYYKRIMIYDENKNFIKCYYTYDNYGDAAGNITSDMKYVRLTTVNQGSQGRGYGDMRSYLVTDTNYLVFTSDTSLQTLTIPHLYTDGQVKVYSDSDVYPTTILNGQSTNNYEVNELNKSNNYTIRYDGTCESINLNGKSNEQGTNRIVKTSTNGSGNLTFVNNSEDIDNVLLVQNDVREQEINHFTGLETVEVNQLLISSKQNLFEAYMKNDFDYEHATPWNTSYSSLHRGVFNCGVSVAGNNNQLTFDLIHPKIGGGISEETPIMKARQIYNISCDITVNDDTSQRKYEITFYDKSGSQIYAQRVDNILPVLSLNTTADNTNTTSKINANTFFNEDVYDVRLHAIYGGAWKFDCTITDFTICEPEYAKPDVPLVYEYIDLPQPVQLNSLPDGTCDTYNPITGEYVQNVGYVVYDDTTTWYSYAEDFYYTPRPSDFDAYSSFIVYHEKLESTVASELWAGNSGCVVSSSAMIRVIGLQNKEEFLEYVNQYPMKVVYKRTEPITTQLTPITIPTFEGGILQLITTDGKVFPMVEYSMPTNNRYDTSSWETGAVYTQRNMTEAYFNESTTPMTPTETITLTTDHISSGSIILNDNGNGLIVLKGNYTERDIPYFTGMRSVEAIEVETTGSSDQPLFGKGGRK